MTYEISSPPIDFDLGQFVIWPVSSCYESPASKLAETYSPLDSERPFPYLSSPAQPISRSQLGRPLGPESSHLESKALQILIMGQVLVDVLPDDLLPLGPKLLRPLPVFFLPRLVLLQLFTISELRRKAWNPPQPRAHLPGRPEPSGPCCSGRRRATASTSQT